MAAEPHITRRRFLSAAPVVAAAVALPTALVASEAYAHQDEHPNDKVRRLAREIANTLRDPEFAGFRKVTITPQLVSFEDAEEDLDAEDRFNQHWLGLSDAMDEIAEGGNGWAVYAGRSPGGTLNIRRLKVTRDVEIHGSLRLPVDRRVDIDHPDWT